MASITDSRSVYVSSSLAQGTCFTRSVRIVVQYICLSSRIHESESRTDRLSFWWEVGLRAASRVGSEVPLKSGDSLMRVP